MAFYYTATLNYENDDDIGIIKFTHETQGYRDTETYGQKHRQAQTGTW